VLRKVGGGVVGAIVAFVLVLIWEQLGHRIWPLPEGLDPMNREDLKTIAATMPIAAKAWIVAGWALAGLGAGLASGAIARSRMPAIVVGALLTLLSVVNMIAIPWEWWLNVLGAVASLPPAYLGARLVTRARTS